MAKTKEDYRDTAKRQLGRAAANLADGSWMPPIDRLEWEISKVLASCSLYLSTRESERVLLDNLESLQKMIREASYHDVSNV